MNIRDPQGVEGVSPLGFEAMTFTAAAQVEIAVAHILKVYRRRWIGCSRTTAHRVIVSP